jgi:hypothetical protein
LVYTNFHTTALCSPTRSSKIWVWNPVVERRLYR